MHVIRHKYVLIIEIAAELGKCVCLRAQQFK